ncbi:MAG: carboxypeptidase-like regulatory domain-containing protein [Acidobacteriota bacterium]
MGPLAAARVDLVPTPELFEVVHGLLQGQPEVPAVASTQSDADGRFVLQAPSAGLWRVRISAPGHVQLQTSLVALTQATELAPATLMRDVGAELQVVDAAGQPVVGAGVWIGSARRDLWQPLQATGWRATLRGGWTDAEGRLEVPRLAGESLKVEVWSPGGDAVAQAQMVDAARVTLPQPGRQRTIEVRTAAGNPASDVLVTVGTRTWPLGVTDADGRRSVPLLGAETQVALFHRDGRLQVSKVSSEGAGPVVLELEPARSVAGKVVDRSGRAVAGALVWPAHHSAEHTWTASDGSFELLPSPREKMQLEARAPGFLPGQLQIRMGVDPGAPKILTLDAQAEVRGLVVAAGGEPLPGAQLTVRRVYREYAGRKGAIEGWASADSEGRFQLTGLTSGLSYRVQALHDGYATAEMELEGSLADESSEALRLVLHPGRAAFGLVYDLEERPLAGVEVRLLPSSEAPAVRRGASEAGPQGDPFLAFTDERGRFETRDVPAGRLDMVARGRGLAPLTVRGLELPPGRRPVDLGTLYLEPGVQLEGRVFDSEGEPLAEAEVWVAPAGSVPLESLLRAPHHDRSAPPVAISDAEGRFVVADLAPRQAVDLWIDRDGFLPTAAPGLEAPSTEPLRVELRRAASRAGKVVVAAGDAVAGAAISARSSERELMAFEPPTVTTDETGAFELVDVAPGRLEVDALAEGFQPSREQTFELVGGQRFDKAVFVLERGALLEGWISSDQGAAVADAQVLVGRHSATTDAEGAYEIAGIPPGSQQVEVRHDAYNPVEKTLELELGSQRADFELIGGHVVAGRVIDDSGLPVAGAVLELEGHLEPSQLPRVYTEESSEAGSFRWSGIANGRYRLVARKAGFVTAHYGEEIEIDGAGSEDLELQLGIGGTISGQILGLSLEELAGVKIKAESSGRELAGSVDYEGHYRVVDAAPGDWLVVASLPGGGRQTQARVVLAEGAGRVERDLEFGAGLTLTGTVWHGENVLASAKLSLVGADVATERKVRTDIEGRFEIADLPVGSYRLSVTKPSLRLIHNQDMTLASDQDVTIEIATVRIAGDVRAADSSEPLVDAMVMLKQVLDLQGNTGSLFTAASDAGGRFALEHLTAGRYQLTVRRDGYQPLMQDLDVPATGAMELPLSLEPTPGLEVMARLASGRAPRLLTLVALDGGGQPALRASRVLDPEGFIRFSSFPEGTWDLLVSSPDSALLRTSVSVPGEPLAAVLRDAGPLRVRVPELVESDAIATLSILGADQRPFLRLDSSGQLENSWPVIGGWATVSGVPAGAWTLSARADDGRAWTASVVTTGGPSVEVELVQ